jgi:hypothetical protein
MSSQHTFEDQGKVQPKPEHEEAAPNKAEGPYGLRTEWKIEPRHD